MTETEDYQRNYREIYLSSPRWRETASAAVARAGACKKCGSVNNLDAHHKTYQRMGCERPGDIIVFCRPCHEMAELLKTVFPQEEATERFLNIPDLRVTLFVTGFSDERGGLGDRGNFWYQDLARHRAGSVNFTLNRKISFSGLRRKLPVGRVEAGAFRERPWDAPFGSAVPLSVRIFARDAIRKGNFRGVTDDGLEVNINPEYGSRPFPGAELLPECSREQAKVLAEIIHRFSRRQGQLLLF